MKFLPPSIVTLAMLAALAAMPARATPSIGTRIGTDAVAYDATSTISTNSPATKSVRTARSSLRFDISSRRKTRARPCKTAHAERSRGAAERSRELARDWGAWYLDGGARGHLNGESGLGDWPEGRVLLNELLKEE